MLSSITEIPEFITDYITNEFSSAKPEQIQVYKADSGWLLRMEKPKMASPFYRFFGEVLTNEDGTFSLDWPVIYINKDALSSSPEYGYEVVYGYGNDNYARRTHRCDTEFTKEELISWITDVYKGLETTETSFDGDSAVATFLNNITPDSYHGTSVIRYMVDSRQYPFNFIKDVRWLN